MTPGPSLLTVQRPVPFICHRLFQSGRLAGKATFVTLPTGARTSKVLSWIALAYNRQSAMNTVFVLMTLGFRTER